MKRNVKIPEFKPKHIDFDQCWILNFGSTNYQIFVVPQNEAFENDEVQSMIAAYGIRLSWDHINPKTGLRYLGELNE